MTTTHCLPHQTLVDSIRAAVDRGDGRRLAQLLNLLELVAEPELLDRVEAAVSGPAPLPPQRDPRSDRPRSQHTGHGKPKRT